MEQLAAHPKPDKIGCCEAAGCQGLLNGGKGPLATTGRSLIGVALKGAAPEPMPAITATMDNNRYIVAFCGSGTGHLTQALAVVRMLKAKGMVLAGVITDVDARSRMLEEMIMPLGVEVLIMPTIKIVDNEKGMVPIPMVVHRIFGVQSELLAMTDKIGRFLSNARADAFLSSFDDARVGASVSPEWPDRMPTGFGALEANLLCEFQRWKVRRHAPVLRRFFGQ